MIPKLKMENEIPVIEGDFNFTLSQTILSEDYIPYKEISFKLCWDIPADALSKFGDDKIIEMFAEKLKNDFMKLNKG